MALSRAAMAIYSRLPGALSQQMTACYFKASKMASLGVGCQFHSESVTMTAPSGGWRVKIIPALKDNYMYLLIDESSGNAAVIDPVEPQAVLDAINHEQCHLQMILTTHHHWDHAGGNKELVNLVQQQQQQQRQQQQQQQQQEEQQQQQQEQKEQQLAVYGGDVRIPALTHKVSRDRQPLTLGSLYIQCLLTPCHTSGHVCYHVTGGGGSGGGGKPGVVFTGDTLFQAGCGRFFEGDALEMYTALIDKLSLLPHDTEVYCGHEYTLQNLAFARHVEPDNKNIIDRIAWAERQRSQRKPTVPSTIGLEKLINPFMRVLEPSVQRHTATTTATATASDNTGKTIGIKTMHALRNEKDNF